MNGQRVPPSAPSSPATGYTVGEPNRGEGYFGAILGMG